MKNRMSFSYFLKEGVRSIFHHGFMSFATVSIILACLLITGSVTLLSFNINLAIADLQAQSEIVVWVDDSYSGEQARGLERELLAIENVASVEFKAKDTALEEFRAELGEDAGMLDDFDSEHNPLPDSYHVTLKDVSLVRQTRSQIRQIAGVDDTDSSEDTIAMLLRVQRVCQIVSLVLVIALGAISIFIISNTVKLAMFSRRDEIAIMKMVGATNWFIRWPFVIEGLLLGLVG
ncbi:MAG: permease-like cell division protein FtsX, partial [Eubacteriales bacterium]|nr:permease-like cell division protein FtsX [Eubacteriales bacterium]